jgi:hypothetical protein
MNDRTNSYNMLRLNCGVVYCPSVNISLNKCYSRPVILCTPYTDSSSVTCSFTYSSFVDNNAIDCICIYLNSGAEYKIKCCNILRNMQVSSSQGMIITWKNVMIEDSCILENKATYILYQGSSSYTITLSNCTLDSISSYGNVVTQNIVTKSFILALNHMSTRNCHVEYDSAGNLSPLSKKQFICYTFGKCLCYPQLSDFFSFHSIFVFNFIHPYTSFDQ